MEMIETMFRGAWQLFGLECPGLGVSFAVLAVGFSLIWFTAKLLLNFLGFTGSAASSYDIVKYRRRDR